MKKLWISIGELAGFKVADDAGTEIKAQEAELEKVKSALEDAKGHLTAKEKAEADLATAKTDHEKAIADLKAAHETALKAETDKVAALEEKVKELGGKPGGEPTGLQKPGGEVVTSATSWMSEATRKAGHNQFAAQILGIS
jgi:conjugal transfer/entry exclusion protein